MAGSTKVLRLDTKDHCVCDFSVDIELTSMNKAAAAAISRGVSFLDRQQRDWKVTVVRASLSRFLYQMVFPYQSIYTVALGATATQLGIVNSAGMGVASLMSPLTGSLIDRFGVKTIYLIGIGFLFMSYLTYGVAQNWTVIIIAMMAYWLGHTTSVHGCLTVCGNSLANEDRATAMTFCETLTAGLLGLVGPMFGALLVTTFGGVSASGIRPLFFLCFVGTAAAFLLILTQLSNRRWERPGQTEPAFFSDLSAVFKQGRNLKRWLVVSSVSYLPMSMVLPFSQVFAHEVKGADQYILGAMVTGFALTPLVCGIPLGRLADKIGRKKVLYLIAPAFWASNLMLIWTPSPEFLIATGVLQGFFHICTILTAAMSVELVPPEQMGKWLGIMRFFRLSFGTCSAFVAGIIWDNIGPQYVFLTVIGLDLLVRIPLLIGMPETLGLRLGAEQKS